MKLTDDQMLAQLELLEKQAVGYYTGEIASEQAEALDYYHRKPFGTEEEGRSAVVSSDVWDVVEGLTPMILRPFLASDDVVQFNPLGPDDEEAAKQESEYINWVVTQRNDSFAQLVAWAKTGLLQKNGVVKYWWEKSSTSTLERYYGKEPQVIALMMQDDPSLTLEGFSESEEFPGTYDVELRKTDERGQACYAVIPPEEFLISRDASTPSPKAARFVQHRRVATIGALRAMGYEVPDDMADGFDFDPQFSEQYQARRSEEERNSIDEGNDPSQREVLFKETFWQIDKDGDGIPELRKLCTVGKEILADEETEEVPFAAWTPYPQPFKFYGNCPGDETKEIQLVKSTIIRETMNNLYTINNNRTYANDDVNLSDLIDNQIAGVVRVKGTGPVTNAVRAAEVTPIGAITMPMIEYWDGAKENRTGFTRYNQGSADLGNQKTLGEVQLVTEQSGMRTELVTRSFANGVAELMRGIHGLCRRHATKAETIRLRGKWIEVDPRGWKKRADLTIGVGLGNSDQRMKLQGIQMLMNEQKAQIQLAGGKSVSPMNLYTAAAKLSEIVGFKTPEQFFSPPQQEQGLPPEVQQAMQQMQQMLQEAQAEIQQLKSGVEVKAMEVQSRERIEQAKMQNALLIENKRDDQKRDGEELKAWLQLVLQRMQPNVDLSDEVAADAVEAEPVEEKPDPMLMIAQAMQGISAPKRKVMSIRAPSGQVYEGVIQDEGPEVMQ
jgi:hypothetical protein